MTEELKIYREKHLMTPKQEENARKFLKMIEEERLKIVKPTEEKSK